MRNTMKKILCASALLLFLSGCNQKEEDVTVKKTTCSLEQTLNNVTFQTTQEIEYIGETVRSQKQIVQAQFKKDDKKAKESVEASIKENEEKYKDVKGMSFEASLNKDYLYKEEITFDFKTISATDYGKITEQKLEGDKVTIDYQQSKNNLEKQGFTCKE